MLSLELSSTLWFLLGSFGHLASVRGATWFDLEFSGKSTHCWMAPTEHKQSSAAAPKELGHPAWRVKEDFPAPSQPSSHSHLDFCFAFRFG